MKSKILTSLLVVVLLISSQPVKGEEDKVKNWTIMFYGCYDAKEWWDFFRFIENLSSFERTLKDGKVDVGILLDVKNGSFIGHAIFDSKGRFRICSLEKLGEINTGNSSTLREFILYCKQKYPAKRYLLIINGHGLGPFVVCPDSVTGGYIGDRIFYPDFQDYLTLDELRKGISKAGCVDILFQMSCNLGCIEAAYELKNCTDVYISLESTGYYYSPQIAPFVAFSNLMKTLSSINDGDKDSHDVAKEIVESVRRGYPYVWEPLYGIALFNLLRKLIKTRDSLRVPLKYYVKYAVRPPYLVISSVDCKEIGILTKKIDSLSKNLTHYIKKHKFSKFGVKIYRKRSREFMLGSMVDIGDFFSKFCKPSWKIRDRNIYKNAHDIIECLSKVIIAEYHQIGSRGSYGLSVYYPSSNVLEKYYGINLDVYCSQNLSFVKDTSWIEFLKEVCN